MEGENASPDNGQLAGQEGAASTDTSWFDSLHADIQAEKTLEKFKAEDGLNKLAQSYVGLEKKLGNAVWIPGDNATEQDVLDFRKKLGIPETPDKYELKYKEHEVIKVSEEQDKEWRTLAHKIGLTPKQAQELADFEFGRMEKAVIEHGKKYQAAEDALRQEFGNGYQDVLDRANNVLRSFTDQATLNTITNPDGPYANDPNLIKLLANIGAQMGEHTFKTGEGKTQQDTKDEIMRKVIEQQNIYMDPNRSSPERQLANREAQRLLSLIYGDKEVSSSADMKM